MAHRRDIEGSLRASETTNSHSTSDSPATSELGKIYPPQPTHTPKCEIINRSNSGHQCSHNGQKDRHTLFTRLLSATIPTSGSAKAFDDFPDAEGGGFIHRRALPTKLLGRFHFLCVVLTLFGFIFALIGIICLTWDRLPHDTGIICVVIIVICLIAVVAIILLPDSDEECPGSKLGAYTIPTSNHV